MCFCVWYGMFYSCLWPVFDQKLKQQNPQNPTERTRLRHNARGVRRPLVRALVFMLWLGGQPWVDSRIVGIWNHNFHIWNPRELLIFSLAWTLSLFSLLLFFSPLSSFFFLSGPSRCPPLSHGECWNPRAAYVRGPLKEEAYHLGKRLPPSSEGGWSWKGELWNQRSILGRTVGCKTRKDLCGEHKCLAVLLRASPSTWRSLRDTCTTVILHREKQNQDTQGGHIEGAYPGVCFPGEEFGECCWVPSPEGQWLTGNIITLHLQRPSLSRGATDVRNARMWHLTLMKNAAGTFKR